MAKAGRICAFIAAVAIAALASANDGPIPFILHEQRFIAYRDPAVLPHVEVDVPGPPRTVTPSQRTTPTWELSLDDAIHIALQNARVIRVLAGFTAVSSGQTIYDPAITNTTIDQEQARFDPVFRQRNSWARTEPPEAFPDLIFPGRVRFDGRTTDTYRSEVGLNKTNVFGGNWDFSWVENPTHIHPGDGLLLNPFNRNSVELSYTQPLLQGGGRRVNLAPVVIARINTERSYFQYKESVQELVRGVIEGYWNLVLARTDVWARGIQLQLSQKAYEREKARMEAAGLANLRDVSQALVTYNQFRASLIASEARVLDREAALRNIMGLPPDDGRQLVPVSEPVSRRLPNDWQNLIRLAEERRPDIVELKLVLEADQIRLAVANNQVLPRLDAVGLYRWNGLTGEVPSGERFKSASGQFADWTLGINFSVPLGLRQGRAGVRQQELLIARDRANLQQGVHAAVHEVAQSMRDLDNAYEQYMAYQETRTAASKNLAVQTAEFGVGRNIYLNVLQALNDWGNSVFTEAQALLGYNVALATLERRTGTILESHGLVFFEERMRAAGPLGVFGDGRCYPAAMPPAGKPERYPGSASPSENFFDLKNPAVRDLPPPNQP